MYALGEEAPRGLGEGAHVFGCTATARTLDGSDGSRQRGRRVMGWRRLPRVSVATASIALVSTAAERE